MHSVTRRPIEISWLALVSHTECLHIGKLGVKKNNGRASNMHEWLLTINFHKSNYNNFVSPTYFTIEIFTNIVLQGRKFKYFVQILTKP